MDEACAWAALMGTLILLIGRWKWPETERDLLGRGQLSELARRAFLGMLLSWIVTGLALWGTARLLSSPDSDIFWCSVLLACGILQPFLWPFYRSQWKRLEGEDSGPAEP